jgi:hypothetical protein
MESPEPYFVWDASAKKLREIQETAWESSSTSPQECNDSNSFKPSIGRGERRLAQGSKCIFSADLERRLWRRVFNPKAKMQRREGTAEERIENPGVLTTCCFGGKLRYGR